MVMVLLLLFQQLNHDKLCAKAKLGVKEFLYRIEATPHSPCPNKLLTSSW